MLIKLFAGHKPLTQLFTYQKTDYLHVLFQNAQNRATESQFGTSRTAEQVLNGWRRHLSLNQVITMQKHCGYVLRKLGYTSVNSISHLKNEDNILW